MTVIIQAILHTMSVQNIPLITGAQAIILDTNIYRSLGPDIMADVYIMGTIRKFILEGYECRQKLQGCPI